MANAPHTLCISKTFSTPKKSRKNIFSLRNFLQRIGFTYLILYLHQIPGWDSIRPIWLISTFQPPKQNTCIYFKRLISLATNKDCALSSLGKTSSHPSYFSVYHMGLHLLISLLPNTYPGTRNILVNVFKMHQKHLPLHYKHSRETAFSSTYSSMNKLCNIPFSGVLVYLATHMFSDT